VLQRKQDAAFDLQVTTGIKELETEADEIARVLGKIIVNTKKNQ